MGSMSDALRRAGLVAQAENKDEEQPANRLPTEPCSDETGRRCAAIVAVLGRSQALRLLQDQLDAPYGRARQIAAIEGAIARRIDSMKVGAAQDIRATHDGYLSWQFHRASDLADALSTTIDALTDGSFDAWARVEKAAASAAKWPEPPVITSSPADHGAVRTETEAYRAKLQAWESERTPRELRALAYPGARGLVETYREALESARRTSIAGSAHVRAAEIRAAYESGQIDWTAAKAALEELPFEAREAIAPKASWHVDFVVLGATRRAWLDGNGDTSRPLPADVSLSNLSVRALGRMRTRTQDAQVASDEIARRLPEGQAYVYDVPEIGTVVLFRSLGQCYRGGYTLLSGAPSAPEPRIVKTTPSPDGWVTAGLYDTPTWVGPDKYEALARLQTARRGCLDIRRVMSIYGRHETANWPRLRTVAWKTALVVAVDDPIAQRFDDLAALAGLNVEIPEDAWWIDARVTSTQKGGLRIAAGRGTPGALIQIYGGQSSHGRHGVSGDLIYPTQENKAPCAMASGGSRGGGQHRSAIIAAVTESTPLLLSNGVGYIFESGKVYRMPGLADGRPGQKQEV